MRRKTKARVEYLVTIVFVLSLVALVAYLSGATTEGALQPTIESAKGPDVEPTESGDFDFEEPGINSPPIESSGDQTGESDEPSAELSAWAYYAFDLESGDRLLQASANREVPIASLVKIATALVVIRNADLDDEVTIEASDLVDPEVDSNMLLVEGDTLTVDQLLQGMLIPSGSDAANALARHVGLSLGASDGDAIDAFVDEMNALASELGLEHTHFTNPTGADEDGNYSSAHDIAILAGELMRDDTLSAIVGQADYSFVSTGFGQTYSGVTTNQLLGTDGVIGVKTGSTESAGGCVVFAREGAGGEMQIIALLGSDLAYDANIIVLDRRWDDARALFALLDSEA
jgi:D-alanyl-D-alanine carboxypeptidase (penicillin-binding protein 5/6)